MSTKNQALAATLENDPRWAAVLSRDARADGQFFYSVNSTALRYY